MLIFSLNFVDDIGAAGEWFYSLVASLIDNVLSSELVGDFLKVCIVLSCISLVLAFLFEFTELTGNHVLYKEKKQYNEAQAEMKRKQRLSENEAIYEKRRAERRADAEERYRLWHPEKDTSPASYDINKVIEDDKNKPLIYFKKTEKLNFDKVTGDYSIIDKNTGDVVRTGNYYNKTDS